MTIRFALPDDLNQVAQLYYENHIRTYRGLMPDAYISSLTTGACLSKWEHFLRDPEKKIWIAHDSRVFLGFAAGEPDPELMQTWYLASLHVVKDARGKGVGSSLIRAVGAFAAEKHYQMMSVCIVRGNDRAGELYQKLGATHYRYFEDTFLGFPSNSEKLLWEHIPC